jgi:uncharacterized OB-fold protein
MTPRQSFRPDVFVADPPTLLAGRCPDCGCKAFPVRESCPACGSDQDAEQLTLSGNGEVYSYTIVRQAPAGLPTPYVLAYVDLPDDSIRVMSRLDGVDPATVTIGMPVQLTAVQAGEPPVAPEDPWMFAFRPREGVQR